MGSNFNMKPITPVLSCSNSFNPTLHGLSQACSTLFLGGEGEGREEDTKCPRPFSLKLLKLLQSNLAHKLIRPIPIN